MARMTRMNLGERPAHSNDSEIHRRLQIFRMRWAGCGALATTFFLNFPPDKVGDREGPITNTRGECAPRSDQFSLFALIHVFRGWLIRSAFPAENAAHFSNPFKSAESAVKDFL
jgi:hypothetical protein